LTKKDLRLQQCQNKNNFVQNGNTEENEEYGDWVDDKDLDGYNSAEEEGIIWFSSIEKERFSVSILSKKEDTEQKKQYGTWVGVQESEVQQYCQRRDLKIKH
jgi:hypothetical protein